jgi:hypothetical protein
LPPKWDLAMTQEKQVNEDLKCIVDGCIKNVMFYKMSRHGWKKIRQAQTLTGTTMHDAETFRLIHEDETPEDYDRVKEERIKRQQEMPKHFKSTLFHN